MKTRFIGGVWVYKKTEKFILVPIRRSFIDPPNSNPLSLDLYNFNVTYNTYPAPVSLPVNPTLGKSH